MEEAAETNYCSNCRRDIPAGNFVMHVTHCQRNLTLCKICGEPVPTSLQEEHFEEYHAKVKCECGEELEKMNLEEHKENTCPNRILDCQFCELQLPFCKLSSHVEYCGSRTEKCDTCNRFIQKKDLEKHIETGCQYPAREESKKTLPETPEESYLDLQGDLLRAMRSAESPEGFPGLAKYSPSDMTGWHVFQQILDSGLGVPPLSGTSYFDDATYGAFNGSDVVARGAKPKPLKPMFNHRGMEDFERDEERDDDEMLAAAYNADVYGNEYGFDEMPSGIIDASYAGSPDETELPCEFCGELLPMDSLILHQSGCQFRSMDSFSSSNGHHHIDSHERSVTHVNNSAISRHREIDDYETEQRYSDEDEGRSDDSTFLPCEFCQELFPFDSLIAHQSICDVDDQARLPLADMRNGAEFKPLNNTRPQVRSGPTGRPSRPVYGSRTKVQPAEDFIPSELDDSGSDLDFSPKDTWVHISRVDESLSTVLNNESSQATGRTIREDVPRRPAMIRNNDTVNRQPRASFKNREPKPWIPQAKPRDTVAACFSKTSKPGDEEMSRRKISQAALSIPAGSPANSSRPSLKNNSCVDLRRQMSSNGHFSDHAKSNTDSSLAAEIPRKSGAPTNKAQRSNNGNPSMKSFLGAAALQSSKSKPREELPTIRSSGNSSTNPSSRNPRRNPPTKILEQARSNGGRPRTLNVRGLSSEFQSSSTRTVAPTKKSTTRKKIV